MKSQPSLGGFSSLCQPRPPHSSLTLSSGNKELVADIYLLRADSRFFASTQGVSPAWDSLSSRLCFDNSTSSFRHSAEESSASGSLFQIYRLSIPLLGSLSSDPLLTGISLSLSFSQLLLSLSLVTYFCLLTSWHSAWHTGTLKNTFGIEQFKFDNVSNKSDICSQQPELSPR